jgi:translation initiation factor IF-2
MGIRDTLGKLTEKARLAMPVVIEGLKGPPVAEDDVTVVGSEERGAGRKRKYEKNRLREIDHGAKDRN